MRRTKPPKGNGKNDSPKPLKDPKTGHFLKGNNGGPGRPKGIPNKTAVLVRGLWSDQAGEVAKKVLALALTGDLEACRLVLDRMFPKPKDAPVCIDLPNINTVDGIPTLTAELLKATASGVLTPMEAQTLSGIAGAHAKALETSELAQRIKRIEELLTNRGK